jgi:hypothetical protein
MNVAQENQPRRVFNRRQIRGTVIDQSDSASVRNFRAPMCLAQPLRRFSVGRTRKKESCRDEQGQKRAKLKDCPLDSWIIAANDGGSP